MEIQDIIAVREKTRLGDLVQITEKRVSAEGVETKVEKCRIVGKYPYIFTVRRRYGREESFQWKDLMMPPGEKTVRLV